MLVTNHCDYNCSLASADIALQVENLPPRAQFQLALGDRHGQGRAEQCRLQMRVAVAIMPGLLVSIGATGRDELVQNGGKIFL